MPKKPNADGSLDTVRDGIFRRYGKVAFDVVDSDEFRGLKLGTRCVYMAMTLFANSDTGQLFPMQDTLAELCGIRRETVNRAITEMVNAGLVHRETRPTPKGRRSIYTLVLPPSKRPK